MGAIKDLTGTVFGRLTVISQNRTAKRLRWNCSCICGGSAIAEPSNLRSGNTTSCGCQRTDSNSKVRPGMVFGRLKVLARDGSKRYGKVSMTQWHCVCDCGNFKSALGMSLMVGDTKSCGCLHSESARKNGTSTFIDLEGKEFGELVVIARASVGVVGNVRWLCACSCGALTILRGNSITRGTTISCGCKRSVGKTFRSDAIRLKQRIFGARRRAAEISATLPFDEDLFLLVEAEAYSLAQLRTNMTGMEWAVDHMVPLQSDLVCGLHNEYNLDVITGSDNSKKRNYYWPDMPTPLASN